MQNSTDNEPSLPMLEAAAALNGTKDGRGIGAFVDAETLGTWVAEYVNGRGGITHLEGAFRFGVEAEGRFAGQSFIEAEPEIRSEWSSERGRVPWDNVRDAVWAGFDRAREHRV